MVGQSRLIKRIEDMEQLSGFIILTGLRGSGKKTFINEIIYPKLSANGFERYTLPDVSIDSIREMISTAYKSRNMIYVIPDADNMSVAAKNAMLKIVEECPNNNVFIMILEDVNSTLPTIKSRAFILYMEQYTLMELNEYAKRKKKSIADTDYISICETPGDVLMLSEMNPQEFFDYVKKVVDNIATVSGSNSFKIAEKIAFKEDDTDKYDIRLFWKAFMKECTDRAVEYLDSGDKPTGIQYLIGARDTSRVLRRLSVKGINKQMLFDTWVLDVRKDWK